MSLVYKKINHNMVVTLKAVKTLFLRLVGLLRYTASVRIIKPMIDGTYDRNFTNMSVFNLWTLYHVAIMIQLL